MTEEGEYVFVGGACDGERYRTGGTQSFQVNRPKNHGASCVASMRHMEPFADWEVFDYERHTIRCVLEDVVFYALKGMPAPEAIRLLLAGYRSPLTVVP